MGARLVAATLNPHWSHLGDRAFRVLTIMALTALDTPRNGQEAGLYWAGHEYLCAVMYGTDDPAENQRQAVKRAVRELVKAGAIEVAQASTGRRRARYRVTADQLRNPVDNPVDNRPKPTNRGPSSDPLFGADLTPYSGNRGSLSDEIGGHSVTPGGRKEEEERQEETKEPTQVPTQPQTARVPDDKPTTTSTGQADSPKPGQPTATRPSRRDRRARRRTRPTIAANSRDGP